MRHSLAAVGTTAAAVACCAVAPAVITAVGGVSIALALGSGAALVATIAGVAALLARRSGTQAAERSEKR